MTKRISGRFNGTGAACYLCLGFIPDWIRIWTDQAETDEIRWEKIHTGVNGHEGIVFTSDTGVGVAKGAGIIPYAGGDLLTATNQTTVTWKHGVYLGLDPIRDYKDNLTYGVTAPITKWTLGHASNYTGNFDQALILDSGAGRIEVGSRVIIRSPVGSSLGGQFPDYDTYITALTDQGESANEVTLGQSVPTGDVLFLGGVLTYIPMALGTTTPAGVKLNITTHINVHDEVQYFAAGLDD